MPRGEDGQAFVETALVGLVVMALALSLLQFGLWYHAQHVVLGAAQEGARASALDGSTPARGEERATELARAGLGTLAGGVSVSSSTDERVSSVRVEASMPLIVPFLPAITLTAESHAYKERFVPAVGRP